MNTLTVWCFSAPEGAVESLATLRAQHLRVDDAVLVSWAPDRRTPATRQLGTLDGPGRLWDGFWGVLMGLIFLTPLAGPSFGAAAGAFAGGLADYGIPDDFVMCVREHVTPGTSALFVLGGRDSAATLAARLEGRAVEILRSELSYEQEQHLRATLVDG
jgi:uncharacterized membrane protein